MEGATYHVTVEALAGTTVRLWVQAPRGATVRGDEGGGPLGMIPNDFGAIDTPFKRFATHAPVLTVVMPREGADADGYVRREVVLK